MKELPIVKTDSTPLFDMQYGIIKTLSLMTAVEMGIFNHLGEEKTPEKRLPPWESMRPIQSCSSMPFAP